jgi:uncharacterized protein
MAMKPRVTILTLGVDDVERAMKFYGDGLGLPTQGIVGTEFEHGKVAFFDLADGMKLAVFARDDLALDAQIARAAASPTEFSIGHNVNSKKEVDAIMVEARKAGLASRRRPVTRSGAATPAISRTSMVTFGKSCGIPL